MICSSKSLYRLWAALYSDYEVLISRFMEQPEWGFQHFAKIVKELSFPLVMNVALRRGKSKDEYYNVITKLIFDVGKQLWLRQPDPDVVINDDFLFCKRSIAGFFCLYVLYVKQPYPGRAKIHLSEEEMGSLEKFKEDVKMAYNCDEVNVILESLLANDAFAFSATSTDYGVEGWRRHLLTVQKQELTATTMRLRDQQDQIAFSTLNLQTATTVRDYVIVREQFLKKLQQCRTFTHTQSEMEMILGLKSLNTTIVRNSAYIREDLKMHILKAVFAVKRFALNPILTMENLNGSEIIDRRVMTEARKRIQSHRKRLLEEPGKSARPYVREGGIYGRKKEPEDRETRERRERGLSSGTGNLWTFLCNRPFDKPMGNVPMRLPQLEQQSSQSQASSQEMNPPVAGTSRNINIGPIGPPIKQKEVDELHDLDPESDDFMSDVSDADSDDEVSGEDPDMMVVPSSIEEVVNQSPRFPAKKNIKVTTVSPKKRGRPGKDGISKSQKTLAKNLLDSGFRRAEPKRN